MFKSRLLQYPEMYPKSTNFSYLSHYRPLYYAIGNIPKTVCYILVIAKEYHFLMKYVWLFYLANVLRVACSHSVNLLIYGRLDKKLLPFWKLCRKKKQRPQGI